MQALAHFTDDKRLGCENVHLVVGSENKKAALVYARSGFKPTDEFLSLASKELGCSIDEAYAKILHDFTSLRSAYSVMVRENGAENKGIKSPGLNRNC